MNLEQYKRQVRRTPDWPDIRKFEEHLVFVYGTLKKGHSNHPRLGESKFVGEARTMGKYIMYRPSFPVLMNDDGSNKSNHIFGELYSVKPEVILNSLDILEANGYMYNRGRVAVKCLDQTVTNKNKQIVNPKPVVVAWTYIGNPNYWAKNQSPLAPVQIKDDKSCFVY
jgi:gamma-glutamylcyclotransferase (GGCT)/AIG2-like uncharacterized protein YtfP